MLKQIRFRWVAPYVLCALIISGAAGALAWRVALTGVAERAQTHLELASDRLTQHLFRYRELAVVTAQHPLVRAAIDDQNSAVEGRALLQQRTDMTRAHASALVSPEGKVILQAGDIGVSDLDPRKSPLSRALHGALGAQLRVSPDGRLFRFAAPVRAKDRKPIGVMLMVADLSHFEENWPSTEAVLFATGANGAVVVANRSELVHADRASQDFLAHSRVNWYGNRLWKMDGGRYLPSMALHLEKKLPVIGLTMEVLLSAKEALIFTGQMTVVTLLVLLFFGAVLFGFSIRRQALADRLVIEASANAHLEARVLSRTEELSRANAELQRAQNDLVQAGKLAALGQMSAGISHELNQPLTAIRSFADNGVLFLERGNGAQAGANLTRISHQAKRMDRIIKNLRAFARNENEPTGKVDLGQVIDTALELAEPRLAHDGITVAWTNPSTPTYVIGGKVRLEQVFVNLINNAADAMAGQDVRRLTISIDRGAKPRVELCDTGPGILEPDRILEPFYSTKEVGAHQEGLGLGLSISYGLVQSFGGNIRAKNGPDGAIFTVDLEPWNDRKSS